MFFVVGQFIIDLTFVGSIFVGQVSGSLTAFRSLPTVLVSLSLSLLGNDMSVTPPHLPPMCLAVSVFESEHSGLYHGQKNPDFLVVEFPPASVLWSRSTYPSQNPLHMHYI